MKGVDSHLFEQTPTQIHSFLKKIPKCQLHIHIQGTLEPEMIFEIANRNGIKLKYQSVQVLREKYKFHNLQSFLDIYYEGANVLIHEQDFYDLALAYLKRCKEDHVVHTELFVDPQTHTNRGVPMKNVINGIYNATLYAKQHWQISSYIIVCFLRDLDEDSAIKTLEQAIQFKDKIKGIGLDSAEVGNPPSKFARAYEKARNSGFEVVAHAGQQGPAQYVWEALQLLKAKRIDHGVSCLQDQKLLKKLADQQIPLTVCPLSNYYLRLYKQIKDIPIKQMLSLNLLVTINSDDPAYFRGYVNENFAQIILHIKLSRQQVVQLAKNSFTSSFLPEAEKLEWKKKISETV